MGAALTGLLADCIGAPALVCAVFYALAAPAVSTLLNIKVRISFSFKVVNKGTV